MSIAARRHAVARFKLCREMCLIFKSHQLCHFGDRQILLGTQERRTGLQSLVEYVAIGCSSGRAVKCADKVRLREIDESGEIAQAYFRGDVRSHEILHSEIGRASCRE